MNENQSMVVKEDGVSLFDIFKWIFKGKIYGLISAAAVCLICFIFCFLIYNPTTKEYIAYFTYEDVPNLDDGLYIDGSAFNYSTIISEDNINYIIKSSEEYSSIDVERLINDNDINMTQEPIYLDDGNEDYTIIGYKYLITMSAKAFDNEIQAKKFMLALINTPVKKTVELAEAMNYESNLKSYSKSYSYTNKLTYLDNQINLLINGYNEWIEEYSDIDVMLNNEKIKLSELRNDITNYLNERNYYTMKTELNLNGYAYNKEVEKKDVLIRIADLKNELQYLGGYTVADAKYYPDTLVVEKGQLENLKQQLNDLVISSGGVTTQIIASEAYSVLTTKIADVEQEILNNKKLQDVYARRLEAILSTDQTASDEFGSRLEGIYNEIVKRTDDYEKVFYDLNTRDINVSYDYSNVIKIEETLGLVLSAAISVVLGLFVGVVVAWSVGYTKTTKKKEEVA